MKSWKSSLKSSGDSAFLRWELAAIGLVMLVLVAVALLPERQAEMGPGRVVVYGSLILLGALLVALWVLRGRTLANRLQTAEIDLAALQERMAAIFRLSHRFANAQNEADVIDIVLQMCVDVVRVTGAIFVPLDDRNHPLAPHMQGYFSGTGFEAWAEHLAVSEVREACAACRDHQAGRQDPCPLMEVAPLPNVEGIHCFPLRRGKHNFGMLNLYTEDRQLLEPESLAFLSAMLDEMGIAIEAIRLRDRDRAVSQPAEGLDRTTGTDLLRTMLEGLARAIEVPYIHLSIFQDEFCSGTSELTIGNPSPQVRNLLKSHAGDAQSATIDLLETTRNLPGGVEMLLVRPLTIPNGSQVGALVLAGAKVNLCPAEKNKLVRVVADQIGLTAQFTQLVQSVEYQAVMEERARLAREIHDGVAQTLGFLKLLAAQLENNLAKGDPARINQLMQMSRATLAEAYVDARQAIDGLRITPLNGFGSWIQQAADDFSYNTGLSVKVETDNFPVTLLPEVQAQLIRIVQEALTNIRKHAEASQVWITGGLWHGDLVLEVKDDGIGFEPGDIIQLSRHGLKGMQERAELVEAAFQIISQPGEGTTVRVRLPAVVTELTT